MALEIERRFLVSGDRWRQHVRWTTRLQQGYLAVAADGLTVRVRRAGDRAWLTIKARAALDGLPTSQLDWVRQEFEYPIPSADAEQLLALAPQQLRKWRHGLDLPGGDWVLDVFEDANAPLVVAEVELLDPDQPLQPPAWCVLDVTGRHELSNAALAATPLARWPERQRRELLEACATGDDLG
jgi:CYTH domain-containing protein